jgi:hypothetical protein
MSSGKASFKYENLYNNSLNVCAPFLQVRAEVQHLISRPYMFIIILKTQVSANNIRCLYVVGCKIHTW